MSIWTSPPEVSMWASMLPEPNGTSVMTWFIRTACAGGAPAPAFSSRIFLAASSHSSDRKGYLSATVGLPPGQDRLAGGGTVAPDLHAACRNLGQAGAGTAAARR